MNEEEHRQTLSQVILDMMVEIPEDQPQ